MNAVDRISKAFQSAEEIPVDDSSKMILMSDVHRGDGSWADDFSGNENLYFAALTHYYKEQYTYIELGDGDELWKYKNMSDIVPVHKDTFSLLQKYYNEGRLYFIYGNHDMVKSNDHFVQKCFNRYYDAEENRHVPLFENVKFHEGLVLRYKDSDRKILLIHGHQGSMLDYTFWGLRRFLVRYVWKKLELFGFKDPTSTAKNYHKKDSIEQNLTEWVNQEKHMLIAGHTHRPMFPDAGKPLYFNDGSCVHPRSITGIEIAEGNITLVKWNIKTKDNGTLYIGREVLAGPRDLKGYL
ncbi:MULTISPECIES: metallophosphoesterase family protein [Dehalobacter]|jgi:UDP-2,3-diacylglucosamine pyrophosphatase LpxH|uniref:Serine/threonine protein phosphatase n=2 Tax=Dehalobacter restrictus TaxID=55583 RepID=A0A857DHS1_9FIRM|nr:MULTISPECIES: metallophosphoesterase family protein [Dehalobacter]AHF09239.1 Ser/Thr phosphatase [Dehalobacter restrictus DSM 9455]MCG1025754.1 metallophosphoesterase family protein [Dehalobacter sp.]MDJ0306376.1 metallophosphoesterase family protein [Dehalobacter sp.]OCZ51400.1 serine/threonine protein phosphatase [Dehalobacter sp. TeCB1]QGZ99775.1 serine/threonine protein phosphatase [Dehalobacter restrictus]